MTLAPIGNRAFASLAPDAAPELRRAPPQRRVEAVLARRVLARASRDENIAAFDKAVADAPTNGWQRVAVVLNVFVPADIELMTAKLTMDQLRLLKTGVESLRKHGWPVQHMVDGIAASEASRKRPASSGIWKAYEEVKYGTAGKTGDQVWILLAGAVSLHGPARWGNPPGRWVLDGGDLAIEGQPENSCAARASRAFNYGGMPITETKPGWIYPNSATTLYARDKSTGRAVPKSLPGDGKKYIVSAPEMQSYLTRKWGKPDARLKTKEEAKAFGDTFKGSTQIAIFAGPHHVGVIKDPDVYRDPYVFTDEKVLPVSVWTLP